MLSSDLRVAGPQGAQHWGRGRDGSKPCVAASGGSGSIVSHPHWHFYFEANSYKSSTAPNSDQHTHGSPSSLANSSQPPLWFSSTWTVSVSYGAVLSSECFSSRPQPYLFRNLLSWSSYQRAQGIWRSLGSGNSSDSKVHANYSGEGCLWGEVCIRCEDASIFVKFGLPNFLFYEPHR